KLLCGIGDMGIPRARGGSPKDAANVGVAVAVTEPASHLHERVIPNGIAEQVTCDQAFQSKTARKAQAADGNNASSVGIIPQTVIERVGGTGIENQDFNGVGSVLERFLNLGPLEASRSKFLGKDLVQHAKVLILQGG